MIEHLYDDLKVAEAPLRVNYLLPSVKFYLYSTRLPKYIYAQRERVLSRSPCLQIHKHSVTTRLLLFEGCRGAVTRISFFSQVVHYIFVHIYALW